MNKYQNLKLKDYLSYYNFWVLYYKKDSHVYPTPSPIYLPLPLIHFIMGGGVNFYLHENLGIGNIISLCIDLPK